MEPDIQARLIEFSGLARDGFLRLPHNVQNRHFEEFVAFHVLKRRHVADMDKRDIAAAMTGETHDNQLDTLCVLVDGRIARDAAHAEALIDEADDPSIAYVFIQTTTTARFESAKMNQFVTGVQNFFAAKAWFPENGALKARRAIKDRIAELLGERASASIECFLYYVAPGRWDEGRERRYADEARGWRAYAEEKVQEAAGVQAAPEVEVIDLGRLREIVQSNDVGSSAKPSTPAAAPPVYSQTIHAHDLVTLPELDTISKGYMGYVHVSQFLKLLEREDGQGMLDTLAHGNVRAFLGDNNAVNAEIADTLSSTSRGQFLLLNNGVTIVASQASWQKGALRLVNYQIVNGLQTSTIIYRQRRHLDASSPVYVPIKIVVTTDPALKDAVIRSTNRQTAIGNLQHTGQTTFVRELWEAFKERRSQPGAEPLWLERREGEWDRDPAITDDNRVLSLVDMLGAITSTFVRQPHVAGTGEAAMRLKVPGQIFNDAHRKGPYVTVARMLFVVRDWLKAHGDDDLERFEHHLLYGLQVLIEPARVRPDLTSPTSDKTCEIIERRLDQKANVEQALALAAEALRQIVKPLKSKPRVWQNLRSDKGRLTMPLDKRLTEQRGRIKWS